ncbi:MAG: undecaprenyl-diphosphate phosphatase [Gammaproteobacteria bacterium]|nr:undecaprenyl-diphosphate phosphatase [Gammaproteobacteria bacterium]
MSETLQTLLLGVIEGLTEFLPVSSTGHLLIAEHWLGTRSDLFNVAIQAGAILAVVLIYWRRLLDLLRLASAEHRDYLAKLTFAFLVTVGGGLIAKRLGLALPETVWPVALALVIGGIVILLIERHARGHAAVEQFSWNAAFWVGAAQVLAAVFPGTSRSAATIFAAMLAGVTSRSAATEFAFLVGIPTMFAATGYELLELRGTDTALVDWNALLLGFAASAIVAFAAVKWLLRYVQTHRFTVFAWYRILAGLALLWLVR